MNCRSHSDKLWPDLLLATIGFSAMMLVLGVVFGAPASAVSQERTVIGHLAKKTSSVRRRFSDSLVWQELPAKSAIYEGDFVFVSQDSAATINLVDGSRTEIDESTLLILKLAKQVRHEASRAPVVVEIVHGRAVGSAGDREMAVQTGKSITTLEKGARVAFRARREGTTQIDVTRGRATLRSDERKGMSLETMERSIINASGKQESTQHLAIQLQHPAPDHEQVSSGKRQQVNFDWTSHGKGWTYSIEVSRDVNFEDLVVRAELQVANSLQIALSNGIYSWRVRGSRDLEVIVSEERRIVVLQSVPPIGYEPMNGTEIYVAPGSALSLAWMGAPDVERYWLQMARGPDFDEILIEEDVAGRRFFQTRQTLAEGLYCYRVRNHELSNVELVWSAVTCFDLITRPRLRAPLLFESRLDKGSRHTWMGDFL